MLQKIYLKIFTGLLSLIVVLMSLFAVYATDTDKPLEGEKVVIDPGHGGEDSGAIYKENNIILLQEKDVNLAIALILKTLLESAGATVIMTRESDVFVDLSLRAKIANAADADYFISIHLNSTKNDNTTNYTRGCYYPGNDVGKDMATILQQYLHETLSIPQSGPTAENFQVLRETRMPGVLLEPSFISCTEEMEKLKGDARQRQIAQAIYEGIIAYLAPFYVSVNPTWQNFTKPNESHTHYITIKNNTNESKTANITMKLIKASKCISITKYPATSLNLPAKGEARTSFVITSGAELIPDDNLIHQIIVDIEGVKASAIQYANGENIVTDHPDENYDISDPKYPTPAKIDSNAEVGVYLNGFVDGVSHLLGRFNEPVWFIDQDFEPLPPEIETKARKLEDFKVLVIPTYGLSGVDTSEILKYKVREYVKQGGVVICWTQKYGSEFGFLPGTLTGYGANEDQSCWTNAAYIDAYHPIMAGQDSANLDCNADGYFTGWGEAKVILRRVKNQLPALVMYPYGKGWVVAAGLYPDWGYGHNQWSQNEVALVRDLITWAKQPSVEMPETKPNGTITVQSKIQNLKSKIAEKVVIKVIDPDKKPLPPYTLDLTPPLLPNQSRELTLDSSLIPSLSSLTKLGIYRIDCELQDNAGNTIQPQTEANQFAVSEHYTMNQPLSDLIFYVTTPDEELLTGSEVTFPIHIINKGNQDRNITIYWDWTHDDPKVDDSPSPLGTFLVEAGKTIEVPCTKKNVYGKYGNVWRFWVWLYEGDKYLGNTSVGGTVVTPLVNINVNTDQKMYYKGDNVSITLNIQNKRDIGYDSEIRLKVTDANNERVYEGSLSLTLEPKWSETRTVNFTLPDNVLLGIYLVSAEVYQDKGKIGYGSAYFEVPRGELGIKLNLPATFIPQQGNIVSFEVKNVGTTNVECGSLSVSFKEPEGEILYNGTVTFGTISAEGSIILDFNIPVPEGIKFEEYRLGYNLAYEHRSLNGEDEIPCSAIIKTDLNKPSYRVRENLIGTTTVINTGRFKEDLEVITAIEGFNTTTSLSLLPNQTGTLSLNIPIPATLTSGYHYGTLSLILGSSTLDKQFNFYIPEANLEFSLPTNNFNAGTEIKGILTNTGGVDVGYEYGLKLVDNNFRVCQEESGSMTLCAGKSVEVNIDLPRQLVTGDYDLIVSGTQTDKTKVLYSRQVHIQGIAAEMEELRTDKQNYLTGETITATADLKNIGSGDIQDGILTFKVYKNISTIHNNLVEFGFDNNGVINHGSFLGGENLLDEFQVAICKNDGLNSWVASSFQGGPWFYGHEYHVTNRIYDNNYYEVEGYFDDDGGDKIYLTSRYKLFRDNSTYLDCWYTIKPGREGQLDNMNFYFFLDAKKSGIDGPKLLSQVPLWQMSQDQGNWGGILDDKWDFNTTYMFPVGNKTKVGFVSMMPGISGSLTKGKYNLSAALTDDWQGGNGPTIKNIILVDSLSGYSMVGYPENDAWGQKWGLSSLSRVYPQHLVARLEVNGCFTAAGEGDESNLVATATLAVNLAQKQNTSTSTNIKLPEYLTGKLYLVGSLYSQTNQLITQKVSPFYINPEQPLNLNLEVEKEDYKLGEIINGTGTVRSGTETAMDNLWLEVLLGTQTTVFNSGTFSLTGYGSRTFTISTLATTAGILNAKLMQGSNSLASVYEPVKVVEPALEVALEMKEVIGRGTETARMVLKNAGEIPVVVSGQWRVGSSEWIGLGTISLAGGETKVIETGYQLPVTSYQSDYATITLVLVGDVVGSWTKQVEFGEQVNLAVKPDLVYPVGYLEVPFEVVNRGKLDSEFGATFTLGEVRNQKAMDERLKPEFQGEIHPLTPASGGYSTPLPSAGVGQLLSPAGGGQGVDSIPAGVGQLPAWCQAVPRIVVKEMRNADNERLKEVAPLSPEVQKMPRTPNPEPRTPILKSVQSVKSADNNSLNLVCEFYVPAGGTITGSLVFNLGTGNYSLAYDYFRGTGSCNFRVATENIAKISGFTVDGSRFTVEVGVTNLGSNEFKGELDLQTPFYQTRTAVSLNVGQSATFTFGVQGSGTVQGLGTYTARAEILYDGNKIDKKEMEFELEPGFEVCGLEGLRFTVGEDGTITVGVKNGGNAVGEAKVRVKLLDLVDEEKTIWLEPDGVGSLSYRLQVPADFEDGTYSGVIGYQLSVIGGKRQEEKGFTVRIVGIRLNVVAELDKEAYAEGETATLTLKVTNLSDVELGTLNLSAKVKFNDYEGTTTFSLPHSAFSLLSFSFPIHHRGQKLNFGIYSLDDRAIWLDGIYVREAGTLTIIPDKQVYEPGATVTLTVILQEPGTVTLITPGEPAIGTIEFSEAGGKTFDFKLPTQMLTGTYYLYFSLFTFYFSLPFDVRGVSAVIKEAELDKDEYGENESFRLKLGVNVTDGFDGRLKCWIENGTWTKIFDEPKTFMTGISSYEIIGTLTCSCRQKLVYGLYLGTQTLVTSGSKQVDVYNLKKGQAKVFHKGAFIVEIPEGGLDRSNKFDFEEVLTYPLPTKGIKPVKVLEFTLNPGDTQILKAIKVTFNYKGLLPEKAIEESLKPYYLIDDKWEEISNQEWDVVNKKLVFYLPHLSLVGLGVRPVEELSQVIVYPNPASNQVTFGPNLPSPIRVRIFNIAGEEVYKYEGEANNGEWSWRLQNKAEERVASGLYIYVISSDGGEKKIGKIGVIK